MPFLARMFDRAAEPVAPVAWLLLWAALALAGEGADLLALVKPQFEVGRGNVGKGGIVTDASAQTKALEAVKAFVTASGWTVQATADSPIAGGDGNREYLLWARR